MRSSTLQNGKLLLGLTLLSMILMRLVWMDLRTYSVAADPKVLFLLDSENGIGDCTIENSNFVYPQHIPPRIHLPGWADSSLYRWFLSQSCSNGNMKISSYIRLNQGLLVACIVLCVLITRFFTRSWLICLITAAILMSRGRLISANGDVSGQALMMFLITLWLTSACHWLRSGSRVMGLMVVLFPGILSIVDLSLGLLSLTFLASYGCLYLFKKKLTLPLFQQLRTDLSHERKLTNGAQDKILKKQHQGTFIDLLRQLLGWSSSFEWGYRPIKQRYHGGSILRSLDVPFILWLQHKKAWGRLMVGFAVVALIHVIYFIAMASMNAMPWQMEIPLSVWTGIFLSPVDIDITVALGIMVLCLGFMPVWGLISFWEACWVLIWAIFFSGVGAFIWDSMSFQNWQVSQLGWKAGEVLLWFEPVILTFAVVGIYHIMRSMDQRLRASGPSIGSSGKNQSFKALKPNG